MKCTSCGNEIIGGAKFCGKCGTKVEIQSPSPAPMTALIQPEFSDVGVKMKRGNGKK